MFTPLSSNSSCLGTPSTPGSQALEAAKNIKDLEIFKKPIGTAKKKKSKILDEETYIERMGEIIQRDFFPHLEKLNAQNEYLDALEQQDTKKMRELFEKYSFERPSISRLPSPATFETPERAENKDLTPRSTLSSVRSNVNRNLEDEKNPGGLDDFLSQHTSEDNMSFEEILEENEAKHRLKHAWLYKGESSEKNESTKLAITDGKGKKPFELDSWSYKNKNYIMYVPDGVELTSEEKIELAKNKQKVVCGNTRLKENPFNEVQDRETISELAKVQSKASDGKIGVDGKEIITCATPKVKGFTFVATPSPVPGECDSPIMTWGQIAGTPFRLDGGDTPLLHASQGPSFKMSKPPKREQLALQLAEKAGERNRDKKLKALDAARRSLAT